MKRRILAFLLAGTAMLSSTMMSADNKKQFKYNLVCNVSEWIPDSVTVKGAAQGFAVNGGYGFSFHDRGQCIVLDIRNGCYAGTFNIGLKRAHCNSANFGPRKLDKDSRFPLLYVSECGGSNACYVLDVDLDTCKLVQKITYTGEDAARFFDWCVDAKGGYIYTYGGAHMKPKTLRKYRLPAAPKGEGVEEVTLTEKDLIEEYTIDCVMIAQGNHISGRYAWFTDGGSPAPRMLHKYDLKKKTTAVSYDLNDISFEPEDIDGASKQMWLMDFTGKSAKEANLYELKF